MEFKGLRAQYIVTALVGVIAGLIIALVASAVAGIAVIAASVFISFYLNGKYGADGLSRLMARRGCAKYVVMNRRVYKLVRKKDAEKIHTA